MLEALVLQAVGEILKRLRIGESNTMAAKTTELVELTVSAPLDSA